MTPRESVKIALESGRPEGLPPHFELVFKRCEALVGRKRLEAADLEGIGGPRRQRMLRDNARMWAEIYERLDWAICTGFWSLELEDQLRSFDYFREYAGDRLMLSASIDGTVAIPSGSRMLDAAVRLFDHRREELDARHRRVDDAIERARIFADAGVEVVLMCADYCFNDGPWLSPDMFAEFVTPFLARQVEGFQELGLYAAKHTDGDIMPILDQLVSTGIDALHSLDPMAGVDIRQVRRLVGPDLCLMGNVNCALVHAGTPEEVGDSSLYCLEHGGVENGAYVFCTSNCIFEGVPMENYFAMLQAREDFGPPGAKHPKPPKEML
ncbi:MAG: uroporphyrinogen decarboxylase family protein [Armatimonadota bacterium]|nr:uroporphyrinogen decarboxylase family protein [Armatimonadota bacterium]